MVSSMGVCEIGPQHLFSRDISNGKNTGSGTKPIFSKYSIQLSTYVTYYLSAFSAIFKYPL
jgi:hypothetical protein